MSKRKIDETMTEARNARAKRAKETSKAAEPEAPAEAATPDAPPQETNGRLTKGKAKPKEEAPTEQPPREDLVVFAFRLTVADRDLIHKAAGAAKASRYARTLLVAASKGDVKLVSEITAAIRDELNTAS